MSKKRIKIALANGQRFVRESICRILSADPRFDVCINVANGEELITALSSVNVQPDICLLDVQMPRKNGYETMITISENMPSMKVVVLSHLEDEFVVKSMLGLGAHSYLGKQCTIQELQHALVCVYEHGYYCSDLMEGAKDKPWCLDEHEYAFLKYCHTEMTAKEIACKMNVSPTAVKTYRNSLFEKLKVRTRQGLAIFAYKTGIIAPGDVTPGGGGYMFSSM